MDMVQFVRDEIAGVVRERHIPITEIPVEEASAIRMDLIEKFCYGDTSAWLLSCVHDQEVVSEYSWQWVDDFIKDKTDVLLFFEKNRTLIMYRVHNGADVANILRFAGGWRRPIADFYLSHPSLDFVLYYGDDKSLNAVGTASEWLKAVKEEIFTVMGVPPAELYVSNVVVKDFGSELTFECLYAEQRQPVKLIFKLVLSMDWIQYVNGAVAKVRHVFLGKDFFKFAEINTDMFRIKFQYGEIVVEWN